MVIYYGISYLEVMRSVWVVVDAVNGHKEFNIEYPSDSDLQQNCNKDATSSIGFHNCTLCIDGFLIWIIKQSEEEADKANVGKISVKEK